MNRKKFALVFLCMLLVFVLGQFAGIRVFVEGRDNRERGQDAFGRFADSRGEAKLLVKIKEEATKRRVEPVDAVVDRVWQAIPGYNGLEVDVESTYQKARLQPEGLEIEYMYKEIKPKVHLDDLGAHPIYRGNPNKPMVALMINVAWGNEYIMPMLDTLDESKVKATFFFDGSWLKKNVDLGLEIQKRGHQLENHAYSHPNMSELDDSRARLEISKTKDVLKEKLGADNRWFAPPSGDFDDRTVRLAAEQGLKTVLWTLDTIDWRKPPADTIVNRIASKVEPGSLILMHPTASSRDALKGMIQVIRKKGLNLGTVEETLSPNRVSVPGS
ncbi:putative sporulation protein (polysaccharide deacetylase family) [Fontibacillus phaseoli]|uniref:Putative sporulation protein (Polysaccharide deacetylase family) n=1 Tax=Fontibacillus phaseoli TaxID=1416533 RepID=A0A369BLB7_9BACL|nr:polysaccharide deacetylase family protein [Fontibacillus phaseoli]RCX21257.1 putative sporulation protein (polysaccharide deacetylase family) [Fontibacillus phaseoli]